MSPQGLEERGRRGNEPGVASCPVPAPAQYRQAKKASSRGRLARIPGGARAVSCQNPCQPGRRLTPYGHPMRVARSATPRTLVLLEHGPSTLGRRPLPGVMLGEQSRRRSGPSSPSMAEDPDPIRGPCSHRAGWPSSAGPCGAAPGPLPPAWGPPKPAACRAPHPRTRCGRAPRLRTPGWEHLAAPTATRRCQPSTSTTRRGVASACVLVGRTPWINHRRSKPGGGRQAAAEGRRTGELQLRRAGALPG